jgi:hypothetical protein
MEKMQNKNLSKAGMLWYISTSIALLSGVSASLAYHPRELLLPGNLGMLSI